ncbi:competence protein CoiA family protein [Leuconostocaceae bacterium ESL0958]|nr:competence protein CoiA family protein [Leuconostocaceae bacterium ESL0958]
MLIAVDEKKDYWPANLARKGRTYYCPGCRRQVQLRRGPQLVAHFAHLKKAGCQSLAEGESADHLAGKMRLAKELAVFGPVQVEPYLAAIQQRPDLVVTVSDQKWAIEYQCSPLSSERLAARNAGYARLGYAVCWILGPAYCGRRLQAALICRFLDAQGRLFSFLPATDRFLCQDNFTQADFQKYHCRQRAGWHQLAAVFQPGQPNLGLATVTAGQQIRARLKIRQLMQQRRVDPKVIGYLYERGWRLDQLPAWCLQGTAFGLLVPNWQVRLVFYLRLQQQPLGLGQPLSHWEQRLARYWRPTYPLQKQAQFTLYQSAVQAGLCVLQSEKIYRLR